MTPGSDHRPLGPVMWGAIGVTFTTLVVITVYQLDLRIARYAFGALVLACVAVCGAAVWLDIRSARTANRAVDHFRRRSLH